MIASNGLDQGASFSFWPWVSTVFYWEAMSKTKKTLYEIIWPTHQASIASTHPQQDLKISASQPCTKLDPPPLKEPISREKL